MAIELVLTHMSGPRDGEELRLVAEGSPPEVTFGRSDECTVRIETDPDASRKHAKLCLRGGAWWLEDLGSTNGTHLGEFGQSKRIASPVELVPGQIFRFGATRLRMEGSGKPAPGHLAESKQAKVEE
jgi:pSer/pThr/pTyr-binding forkhead associated (FHA) protein